MAILFFLIQIVLNFLLPGLLVKLFLDRFASHLFEGKEPLQYLISFGSGACIQVCALYYLLLIVPGLWQGFYPIFLFTIQLLGLYFLKFEWSKIWYALPSIIPTWFKNPKYNVRLFAAFWIYWIIFSVVNPVAEHDYFEYAIQGKIFFRDLAIPYVPIRYDALTGFCYVGLHGFLLPLFATLDHFQRFFTGIETDYFFRSITGFYWAMILLFQYHLFKPFNARMAGWANLVLMLTYGFYLSFITYHIDCTRIFLLITSLWFMAEMLMYPGRKTALLFGAAAGMTAFVHSLGVFLVVIELGLVLVFLKQPLLNRVRLLTYAFVMVLLFGGIHYLIDTFYGTGWIFQEIKYY
jgi:hypothetical protein